jgi:cell division protein FtsI/penicillin-binding protein 2
MTSAYATLAARGIRHDPQAVESVRTAAGPVLKYKEAKPARAVSQRTADVVTYALQAVTTRGTGTGAYFGRPIAGKTGTAEKGAGRADQSWYAALAPYPSIKYVVVVTDEAGGFGADTAAPMARQIIAKLFGVKKAAKGAKGGPSD